MAGSGSWLEELEAQLLAAALRWLPALPPAAAGGGLLRKAPLEARLT
jgi:hypothetical protein